VRYIETEWIQLSGKTFIKITYLGKDEKPMDSYLMYLPNCEG
jgi:hypothetical protein